MKRIFIFLLIINCLQSFSQTVELNGGMNHNAFYDSRKGDTPFNNSYSSRNGYQIGIGISDVHLDTLLNLRFTLSYINYGGGFNFTTGSGLGSAYTYKGKIDKSVLSFGFYPLNVRVFKQLNFNLGCEVARLVSEKVDGKEDWWIYNNGSGTYIIRDKYKPFSSKMYFGIVARIAYPIHIDSRYSVCPQISCYYGGLSSEFSPAMAGGTKSFRQYFSIGLQRSF